MLNEQNLLRYCRKLYDDELITEEEYEFLLGIAGVAEAVERLKSYDTLCEKIEELQKEVQMLKQRISDEGWGKYQ